MKSLQLDPNAVLEAIRAEILSGKAAPGTPLRQDHLAERLGVSHIPVREALRQLEAEGLAEIRPRRGAIVTPLSANEFEELTEMRAALEPLALRFAAPHLTEKHFARARRILDHIDRDDRQWGALNTEFHTVLYEPANKPRLVDAILRLQRSAERYLHQEADVLQNLAASQREHRKLLSLLGRGKINDACELLTEHIRVPGQKLVQTLAVS